MAIRSFRGSKTKDLLQQHCAMESVDSGGLTVQLEAPCTPIVVFNIYTPISEAVLCNINGNTETVNPGESYTYEGPAVDTVILQTVDKSATVEVVGTETATPTSLTYYELLVNGKFEAGAAGWSLINGVWVDGKIQLVTDAPFRAAGYQIVTVVPNTTLTLSHEGTGYTAVFDITATEEILGYGTGTRTFYSGTHTSLRIYMGSGVLPAGTYFFDNVSLKRFI